MTTTLVVGYGGSDAADRALRRGSELARALSGRLVVVASGPELTPEPVELSPLNHPVVGGQVPVAPVIAPRQEPSERGNPELVAERLIERAKSIVAEEGGVDATFVAEIGDPAERILEQAESHEADMIVVGSHERGVLERLFRRPTDEKIAHSAGCDVLLVHD